MFEALIAQGLVKEKKYENGLSVFKYTKKVFYDGLWNNHPLLLEARGMVIDTNTGEKVIWPFTKVFNYLENGAGADLKDTDVVRYVEKVNGFMAAARIWKGELIVSTTGTLDSEYAELARKHIEKLELDNFLLGFTYLFEICDASDPHIVDEDEGAYLIGMRLMQDGSMLREEVLDNEASIIGAKRPQWDNEYFCKVKTKVRNCRKEGFMIQNKEGTTTIFKWKSPHYLTKKFLMRMGQKKVDVMFTDMRAFREWIDEEYYPLADHIVSEYTLDQWIALDDQERRALIEDYFNKGE